MLLRGFPFAAALCGLLGTGACQTVDETPRPAALVSADAGAMSALKSTLAEALGRASVELGPGDLTQSSSVSVLPPPPGPFETHSLAMPTMFDLVLIGETCALMQRETGESHVLVGVDCRAMN